MYTLPWWGGIINFDFHNFIFWNWQLNVKFAPNITFFMNCKAQIFTSSIISNGLYIQTTSIQDNFLSFGIDFFDIKYGKAFKSIANTYLSTWIQAIYHYTNIIIFTYCLL